MEKKDREEKISGSFPRKCNLLFLCFEHLFGGSSLLLRTEYLPLLISSFKKDASLQKNSFQGRYQPLFPQQRLLLKHSENKGCRKSREGTRKVPLFGLRDHKLL
ncbi:hypothetical protein MarSH_147 [Marseillevirus Shanghai 1]|nr:hypothetical protein MarSH_147 [Marseillevirus Shanghai 1]